MTVGETDYGRRTGGLQDRSGTIQLNRHEGFDLQYAAYAQGSNLRNPGFRFQIKYADPLVNRIDNLCPLVDNNSVLPDTIMNQPTLDYFSSLEEETSRIVDLRGLEAPEPMVKILLSCSELGPHDTFIGRLPHAPHPLFPHLQVRGLDWQLREDTDGSTLIAIRKRS